jgi:hypothetical protein
MSMRRSQPTDHSAPSLLHGRAPQPTEPLEDPVEDHAPPEHLRRVADREVVLGPHVLAAPDEVGDRVPVVVHGSVGLAVAAADVREGRHAVGFEQLPDAVVVGVRRPG